MNTGSIQERQIYHHLNGLKGLACLLVFIGHYLGIYRYAQSFNPAFRGLDAVSSSPFSIFIDEGYWLYLFFVVSGYLVSKSRIGSVRVLLAKIINRFLRLGLPILFSYMIIFVIYKTVGFHNGATAGLFECPFLQAFYDIDYSVKDVLMSPVDVLLFEKCTMNHPYWVLKMMFISSVLIYLINYVFSKIKSPKKGMAEQLLLIIIILATCFTYPIIAAGLIGMLASRSEENGVRGQPWYAASFIILALAICVLPVKIIAAFSFAVLILLIPNVKALNSFFSGKICKFFGDISWGIYSFHWPLICSVGSLWLITAAAQIGLRKAYVIGLPIVFVLTVLISWGFRHTFEKLSAFITKKIYGVLSGTAKH